MRFSHLFSAALLALFFTTACTSAFADQPSPADSEARLLTDRVGSAKATGRPFIPPIQSLAAATRQYLLAGGEEVLLTVVNTPSESAAYALLTKDRDFLASPGNKPAADTIGAASYVFPNHILFVEGRTFVKVEANVTNSNQAAAIDFAKTFAQTLPKGEGDVPVLIKHLPDWENVVNQATYFVELPELRAFVATPLFDVVDFEGAEAVSADYGQAKLVVIEFTTPQLATQNDQRIIAKLSELRTQGQPVPTVYRRVGNYGAFVFNAANEQAANQLVDQIKYEYVTRWLGDSPYPLLEAQRRYRDTTLGVLVSVVKASGLALLVCTSVGGLVGGLLFIYRRAQQREEAYSDAGGMLRLNLDEMTPQNDPARLIGPGN
jgi:Family of unknown function (DUF6599)